MARRVVKVNAKLVASAANPNSHVHAFALFALTALAIAFVWWWLGTPVVLPPSPLAAGQKLYCVSYAPFRDGQDPLVEGTEVAPAQIDADLALLSKYTDCVRTYSVDQGIQKVPEIARRHGLKVLLGLWLSGDPEKNRKQIETAVALGKKYPDTIRAIIVGNEVLLRGEMSATDLMSTIREVKSQVPEPVTYADVWEYWLRNPDVANAVDFVTIHILPYWEDFPLPASLAAAHVDQIRKRVAAAIPNKEIVIGEVGWPSAGRMREGARPSPSNQALVIEQTVALAQREHFRVNVIEAFNQPWKRWQEGSVGGQWGIFDRSTGAPKFDLSGGAVSDHPYWPIQAVAGILLAGLMFGCGYLSARKRPTPRILWWQITAMSFLPSVLFGWTIETVPVESFGVGGWTRSLALAAIAAVAPVVCAMAVAARRPLPTFAALLCRRGSPRDALSSAVGIGFVALFLLAMESALGLCFDPRYRDIPFASLGAAIVPYLVLLCSTKRQAGARAAAEIVGACVLSASAVYIVFNETFANWQAVWFGADLLAVALILGLARDAPD
ncbi:MAG: beta-(1-6) glucans synthase [Xanthobacteraceae bacterium]